MGKFVITRRKNDEFQFNLKAGNGEIILTSEGYVAKESCKKGIESVKRNSQTIERFEKKVATNGKFFFNLKATNGQVVGSSQLYTTESGRDNGIDSVMRNAPEATVEDLTIQE